MIDPAHDLSITKQAEALNISRGSVYYLHPNGTRVSLSGGCARLVQPSRAVVARIDHDGGGILR